MIPSFCLGQGAPVEHSDSHVLLVFHVATDETGKQQEKRFVEELQMILDDIIVRDIDTVTKGFADLALDEQISTVRPLIEERGALAATWINPISEDLLGLHMVAVSEGRALARLVEIAPTPGFEGDLAVAAKELLGTDFLFHEIRDKEIPEAPLKSEPETPLKDETSEVETPTEDPPPFWSVGAIGKIEGGISGHTGPSIAAGGGLTLGRRFSGGLSGRVFVDAGAGYLDGTDAAGVRTWWLDGGLGLSYRWQLNQLRFGPAVEFEIGVSNMVASTDDGAQKFSFFKYKVVPLLELEWWFTEGLSLLLGGGLGITSRRESYDRVSTGQIVLVTPYLSWEGRLGLVLHF